MAIADIVILIWVSYSELVTYDDHDVVLGVGGGVRGLGQLD